MKTLFIITTVVVLALVVPAQAAYLTDMGQKPLDTDALQLAPDGDWIEGRDWGFSGMDFWISELWVGQFGQSVDIRHEVELRGDRATTLNLQKQLTNEMNYLWTQFQIDLVPFVGSTLTNVDGMPNAAYDDVTVTDNGDGSWTILWEMGAGGTGIAVGEEIDLDLQFDIDGDIAFDVIQTPIPEPASLALFAIGAVALVRRR